MNIGSDMCQNGHTQVAGEFRLNLIVTDRDVVDELAKRSDDGQREGFALAALKVGVIAIRQAAGVIIPSPSSHRAHDHRFTILHRRDKFAVLLNAFVWLVHAILYFCFGGRRHAILSKPLGEPELGQRPKTAVHSAQCCSMNNCHDSGDQK